MADVFISYNREDRATAQRYAEALQRAGLSVWWDQTLAPGQTFDQAIERTLREAKAVLVLWSVPSVASRWVRAEATLADKLGTLVPVMIEPCEPPVQFGLTQTADLTRWKGADSDPAWQGLLTHVRRMAGAQTQAMQAPPLVPGRSATSRKGLFVGLGAAAVLAVAAGSWFTGRLTAGAPEKGAAPAIVAAPAGGFAPPQHSVAVMPFVNMSGEAKDEYFSDGLTEELLNSLVRVSGLQVSARTSSFSFKGSNADIPTIARKLNVGAVLEGSVRKVGDKVRITAQLINAVNGYHLWSENYDRDLKDILALQSEIATTVAEALKVKLLPAESASLTAGSTHDPAAYDAYLRGVAFERQGKDEATDREALDAYREALRLDPDFALARAGLGALLAGYANSWLGDSAQIRKFGDEARTHVDRAVQLAPTLAAGYMARARVAQIFGDGVDAVEQPLKQAMALEPNNPEVLRTYASVASRMSGRQDLALQLAARSVQADPLSPAAWRAEGTAYFSMRRYAEAATSYERALALAPENWVGRANAGINLLFLGRTDEAIALLKTAGSWQERYSLAIAYNRAGRTAQAEELIRGLQKEFGDTLAYQYVQVYVQAGDMRRAFEWLDKAVALEDPGLSDVASDPLLDPIRGEPRFKAVLAKLDLR